LTFYNLIVISPTPSLTKFKGRWVCRRHSRKGCTVSFFEGLIEEPLSSACAEYLPLSFARGEFLRPDMQSRLGGIRPAPVFALRASVSVPLGAGLRRDKSPRQVAATAQGEVSALRYNRMGEVKKSDIRHPRLPVSSGSRQWGAARLSPSYKHYSDFAEF